MPRRNNTKPHIRTTFTLPCTRKRRFATEAQALAALEAAELAGSVSLKAYKCPYCNGWHFSSALEKNR